MPRRDYVDDPNAPEANSLVPAASVVVVDEAGRVLLQRRTDNGMWALPGGKMDIGEALIIFTTMILALVLFSATRPDRRD
ncbi:NUDIX domain-containing protein [Streptomyces sp. 1114.5]|nr:NUDIX domain-containing protein [Streptomyces sp. 1114.5]